MVERLAGLVGLGLAGPVRPVWCVWVWVGGWVDGHVSREDIFFVPWGDMMMQESSLPVSPPQPHHPQPHPAATRTGRRKPR